MSDPESRLNDAAVDPALHLAFGDGPVRRGLASVLLALEQRTQSGLRVHIIDPPDEREPPVRPGAEEPERALGASRYQLVGEIGEGGVGVVYKGRDLDLGRDVALKVLRPQLADHPELLQRFVEEAQIGGQLQHPGIVPVYELGLQADDRPYFTMKLVKGETLSTLLDRRDHPGEQRRRFLSIFEQVCHTVAYAHARRVLHRDLKPSNVMVGGFGEVQVVDWGFAKVLRRGGAVDDARASGRSDQPSEIATVRSASDSAPSAIGSVLGTPAYMSPEQARAEVELLDERSDVFALGAILCEILTGQPPYAGDDGAKMLAMAARAELGPALERLDGCGADDELVQIARRCLQPAPAARPRDAQVVAEQVGGYLTAVEERARHAEIEAAKARVRAADERRARRLTVALAASVLAAALLGGGGYLWVHSERQARVRAAEERVLEALGEADGLRRQAAASQRDALLLREKALVVARGARSQSGDVGAELAARADEAVVVLEQERDRERRDQELLARLEVIRTPPDAVFYGASPAATDSYYDAEYAEAFRIFLDVDVVALAPEESAHRLDGAIAQPVAAALDHWAISRRGAHREGWQQLIQVARRLDPEDKWRNRLRVLLSGAKPDVESLRELADAADFAALQPVDALILGDVLAVAFGDTETAHAVYTAGQRAHPQDFLLSIRSGRAADPAVACEYLRAAVALRPEMAAPRNNLGLALQRLGRREEAIWQLQQALRLAPNPRSHNNLGFLLQENGELEDAMSHYRQAVRLAPRFPWARGDVACAHYNLANLLMSQDQLDEAIAHYKDALRLNASDGRFHVNLGNALAKAGKPEEAMKRYRRALELPNQDEAHLNAHNNLGVALAKKGEFDAAIQSYRKALDIDPGYANAHYNLGNALKHKGEFDAAIQSYRKALDIDPGYANAHYNLGNALKHKGEFDAAIQSYRKALDIDPGSANAHYNLGVALREQGKLDEAIVEYRKELRLNPEYAEAHNNLGLALHEQGKLDEAIVEFRKALRLDPDLTLTHNNLGFALHEQGELGEAIVEYRKELRLNPEYAEAHKNLGLALCQQGKLDEAIAEYRKALQLDPDLALTHNNLGVALSKQGKLEEAIAEYSEAIWLRPSSAEVHLNLGLALRRSGRYAESLLAFQRGHEHGSSQPGWRYDSANWVRQAEELAAKEDDLLAIVSGTEPAESAADWFMAAHLAYRRKAFLAAARTYAAALRAHPELAAEPPHMPRYNGACSAVLAALGSGEDSAQIDDTERRRLRRQALTWLREDFEHWRSEIAAGPARARVAVKKLQHRQRDTDLASLREEDALAKLPAREAAAWRALWTGIGALLQRTKH